MLQGDAPDAAKRLLARHTCIAPELISLEVANALATAVKTGRLGIDPARRLLAALVALPIKIVPSEPIVHVALVASVELRASVYDATYLVLARWHEAVLLTADKHLAALAGRAELIV